MPKFTITSDSDYPQEVWGKSVEYATEAQVLEFAQKLRAAGNGDPIDALFPSTPSVGNACLIANALNFKSYVLPLRDGHWDETRYESDGSMEWVMIGTDGASSAPLITCCSP